MSDGGERHRTALGTEGAESGRSAGGPRDGRAARRTRDTHDDVPPATPADGTPQPSPGRRRRAFTRGLLLTLLLAVIALAGLVAWGLMPMSDDSELVEFEVLPGWGASRVARELEEEELVRSGPLFSVYLRVRGLDRSIGEGLYDLDRAAWAPELAEELVSGGRPRVAEVLLPEGLRASELSQRLEAAGLHEAEEYRQLIAEPAALGPDYLPEDATLEGYLFPASYEIPLTDTPAEVLNRMLERFDQELTDAVREELERLEMSVHEWVTLASVVQSEAGNSTEMPLIAGVFLNRLDLGMALQSDPTVAYGLGKALPELSAAAGDLRSDHPWNTYTRPGLPAGPISNPGHAALQAVLSPVRTNARGEEFLYFIHGFDDGEIIFRPNIDLDSHNRDVALYLR